MIINHNLSSINANRNLVNNNTSLSKKMENLSSGLRIARAADDAAGLAVSEKMRSQIRGLQQAVRNINDGINFIQTAEGYLQQTTEAVQRIRELSVQAANGIYSNEDRGYIQVEVSQLITEVDRIASQAQFNGMNLLTGRFDSRGSGNDMVLQVGSNMDQNIHLTIGNMSSNGIGLTGQFGEGGISVLNREGANEAIGTTDFSLNLINSQRANLGAVQNRLELTVKGQMIAAENLQATESQIRDLNMATGMVDLVRDQILSTASTAMLAQANQKTQAVLRLLG